MVPRITPMSYWLRTGMMVPAEVLERKFNPDHDPKTGQFASRAGGGSLVAKPTIKLASHPGTVPNEKPSPKPKANPIDIKRIGIITVEQASNILTNETNGLSGGPKGDLEKAKAAIAHIIINGQISSRPPDVAPTSLSIQAAASEGRVEDQRIMRQTYMTRAARKPDPTNGALFYGTSQSIIKSRPIGNGRQNVLQSYGPFDHGRRNSQYVYIYGPPYFPKKKQ